MLEASIVAFMVCGAFLSRSYFDLYFHFVAITILLRFFYHQSLYSQSWEQVETEPSVVSEGATTRRIVRTPVFPMGQKIEHLKRP